MVKPIVSAEICGPSFLVIKRLQVADVIFEAVDCVCKPGDVDGDDGMNVR